MLAYLSVAVDRWRETIIINSTRRELHSVGSQWVQEVEVERTSSKYWISAHPVNRFRAYNLLIPRVVPYRKYHQVRRCWCQSTMRSSPWMRPIFNSPKSVLPHRNYHKGSKHPPWRASTLIFVCIQIGQKVIRLRINKFIEKWLTKAIQRQIVQKNNILPEQIGRYLHIQSPLKCQHTLLKTFWVDWTRKSPE